MTFVCLNDQLDKVMPDDILLVEIYDSNAFESAYHSLSLHQSRPFARWQVDLSNIAGDDRFGSEADTSKKHLHLFGCSVLSFIENDERVRKGAAAHERKRSNFYDPFFKQPHNLFVIDKIEEGIVERPQIGIDLVLEVAWQESEFFSGFDRRPRKHDSVYTFLP